MCSWCEKKTVGVPQVSGFFLPLICEHCGTKQETILNYLNYIKWANDIVNMLREVEGSNNDG